MVSHYAKCTRFSRQLSTFAMTTTAITTLLKIKLKRRYTYGLQTCASGESQNRRDQNCAQHVPPISYQEGCRVLDWCRRECEAAVCDLQQRKRRSMCALRSASQNLKDSHGIHPSKGFNENALQKWRRQIQLPTSGREWRDAKGKPSRLRPSSHRERSPLCFSACGAACW